MGLGVRGLRCKTLYREMTVIAFQHTTIAKSSHGSHRHWLMDVHMGGCQNYGPFLGPYYSTAPMI